MPRHEEEKVLPYPAEFVFDIVADVEQYPKFLPWCIGSRVYKRRDGEFHADVVIGFKMFREKWTSRVTHDRPRTISVDYIKGPMKHLHNDWEFVPRGEQGTLVKFCLDFEFQNPLFQKLVGHLFEEAVHHMVAAFEKRAAALAKRKKQTA